MGVMEARRRILLNQPHLIDASGNPISFSTDFSANLAECKAAFGPVQVGSGDPSPQNIRSISGWSSCNLWRTGKNLLNPVERDDSYAANIQYNYTNPLKLPAGTYTASCTIQCSGIYILEGNSNIFSKYNSTFITFTLTESKELKFNFYKEGIDHSAACQLELGSTATTYEPYSGSSYPVTFPSEAGTLYGGYVDYERGEVVAEWVSLTKTWGDFLNKTSLGDNTRGVFSISSSPSLGTGAGAMCNIAPRIVEWSRDVVHFYTNEGSCIVTLPNGIADSTEIQVVYPLANPIHYPLTPTLIKSLKGANTVWSDMNGDLQISYWKH